MDAEAVLTWVDALVQTRTGQRLNELQRTILQKVWQGKTYVEIALTYGCTEGHVKDVGSHLWKLLSRHLGEKVSKNNCRRVLALHLPTAAHTVAPLAPYSAAIQPLFVGRDAAIAHLHGLLIQGTVAIVIQGEGGLGKTTLAQHYLHTHGFAVVLELLMAKEAAQLATAERVVAEWLRHDLGIEPSIEYGINLGRLRRQLQTRRIGILIDNLEPALDCQGRLIPAHRSYVELLRVVTDASVQSVTLITSRDRLSEPGVNVTHYRLPGLPYPAWQQIFQQQGITVDATILQAMHHAYGGNAKAMGILCGTVLEDWQGDLLAYWQDYQTDLLATPDLKNLVASQVDRLQTLDPDAYRLFCRLGCYRYQDVPTLPEAGLACLLWDIPPNAHRRTIQSLRHRSLVEYHKGAYWLHPVIRADAIARLRASGDWVTANRAAAAWWTQRVSQITTMQDALQALEAYYQYAAIDDFEAAGQVLLQSRNNQWQQFLPLGSTLYRMGLLQPVLQALTQVIAHLPTSSSLSELYTILGDLRWITGQIHDAIVAQETALTLATQALETVPATPAHSHQRYYLTMLAIDARLSMGLYNIDLWELATAADHFQQVIDRARHTPHQRWADKATICLALVQSYWGQHTLAKMAADAMTQTLLAAPLTAQTGRFAYFLQILGQTYVNLGDWATAQSVLEQAFTFAEAGHYTQIKAKTLNGFAVIYRHQGDRDRALVCHQEAIALQTQIGAHCDLAETYFQMGVTYQHVGAIDACLRVWQQAIRCFTAIAAPQQVAKVQQAMQSLPSVTVLF